MVNTIDKQIIVGDGSAINNRLAQLEGRFKILLRLGIDEFGLTEGRLHFKSMSDVSEIFNLAPLNLTEAGQQTEKTRELELNCLIKLINQALLIQGYRIDNVQKLGYVEPKTYNKVSVYRYSLNDDSYTVEAHFEIFYAQLKLTNVYVQSGKLKVVSEQVIINLIDLFNNPNSYLPKMEPKEPTFKPKVALLHCMTTGRIVGSKFSLKVNYTTVSEEVVKVYLDFKNYALHNLCEFLVTETETGLIVSKIKLSSIGYGQLDLESKHTINKAIILFGDWDGSWDE